MRAPRAGTVCSDWAWGSDFVWPSPSSTRKRYNCDRKIAGNSPMAEATQSNKRRDSTFFYYFGVWDLPTTKSFATEKRRRAHAAIVDLNYRSSPRLTFALALPCSLTPRPLSPSRRARRRASSAPLIVPRRDLAVRAMRARVQRARAGRGRGNGAWAARRGGTNGRPVQYKFTQK